MKLPTILILQLKRYNLANAYIGKSAAYRDMKNNKEYIATLAEGIKAVPGNATLEKLYAIYYLKEGQKFQQAGNIEKQKRIINMQLT